MIQNLISKQKLNQNGRGGCKNWLNSSFFETALRSAEYGSYVTVTSSEIGRATAAGDNYASDIFRAKLQVTLDSRRSTLSLIVKSHRENGEMAAVNIMFCVMLHISDIHIILHSNTLSIFLLHIYNVYIYLQMCRSLCVLITCYTQQNILLCLILKTKSVTV